MQEVLEKFIAEQDLKELRAFANSIPPTSLGMELAEMQPVHRALVFRLLEKNQAIAVFENLEVDQQQELVEGMHHEFIREIIEGMSTDDRARLLDEVPAKVAKKIMEQLTPAERENTNILLGYAPRTAGRIMTPDYVHIKQEMTASEALERIRKVGLDKETIYTCYVTDNKRKLVGVVSLRDLVLAPPDRRVGDMMMQKNVIMAHTSDDQEVVASLIKDHDLLALPVVDGEDRLVGIVTVDDAVDILEAEASEDFHRIVAITATTRDESYFDMSVKSRFLRRLPWLIALLVAGAVSGNIIGAFEEQLAAVAAIAMFIPLIMATFGNAGSQSATLVVRGLATGEIGRSRYLRILMQEIMTGAILGVGLGIGAFILGYLLTANTSLGMAIGLAIFGVVVCSSIVGVSLPFAFKQIKIDPALASAPLITTIGDAISLLLYFNMVILFLGLT
ncbi:MAG: magnesium transporter [Syntrophomonadaceae bacterium]|nr:magnesium transporter [Syntrophomonadaceae bacterium]